MAGRHMLRTLAVPGGPTVAGIYGDLEDLLAGRGDARLPVPASDPPTTARLVDAMRPDTPIEPDVGLVCATSGTTGTPKGALLTAGNLDASATATEAALGGPGRWVLALPPHHIAGLQVLLRSLRAGYTPHILDLRDGFDPLDLPRAVDEASRATGADGAPPPRLYTSLVPGQLAKVLSCADPAPTAALAAFDAILLGGAAAPPDLLERAASAGARIVRTYGMSETAGGCVYDGLPLPGTRVEIDEDESRVWLGGPTVARGYRNATGHPAFATPGWFRTDDAGEIGTDGRLRILGRLDDVLVVGGLKLLPGAVEDALRSHPGVADAVVVGVPDDRLGTRAEAVIEYTRGTAPADPAELRDAVSRRLGRHSAPADVHVVTEWPLLGNGKIDRRAVARAVSGGTI